MDALASHVIRAYDQNKQFRSEEIDRLMLEDLRQLNGEYDPDKLKDIQRAGQPTIFLNKTGEKVRGALAWIMDVINFDNGKPFTLDPSPLPALPPEAEEMIKQQVLVDMDAYLSTGKNVSKEMMFQYAAQMRDQIDNDLMSEAKDRAKKMETLIYDQMVEGGWHDVFEDFLYNLSWAPAAFIKGPILRRVTTPKYIRGPFGWINKPIKTIKPTFEAPSPFDIYPSREAVSVDDGELCERIKLSPSKLEEMKGVTGYQDAAIDKILAGYDHQGAHEMLNTDAERERLEGKGSAFADKRDFIEGVEYWGSVTGKMLKDKGVLVDNNDKPLADLKLYEANVIVVQGNVIYSALNPEMTGKRPYMKTCWHKKPGSFYGSGVPRLMRELQQLINATIRSLCFNMSQSSGYQTIINDIARIPAGERVTESFTGKVWQFTKGSSMGNEQKPVDFWQPDSLASQLLTVYKSFEPEADTITGIPRYAMGNDNNGNSSRTLGGLSILMSNAARGIKMVLSRIDKDIYHKVVDKLFNYNMAYSDDEDVKGDVVIQCSGALSQIVNEQNSQKIMQILTASANPIDATVIGPEERGALYRELAKFVSVPKDTVVKSDEKIRGMLAKQELEQAQQQQMSQAGQGGAPGQVVEQGVG